MRVAQSGASYFALIFALGFLLGTLRNLWGAQALGEATFILIEIVVILSASWFAARWAVRKFVIASAAQALAMGGIAFALLMVAELVLTAALGESVAKWLAGLLEPPGIYGFAGQIAFGLMPWLALHRMEGGDPSR